MRITVSEDTSSKFGDAYQVEMYIENTEGFEGEGDLLSKFGVEVRDQQHLFYPEEHAKGLYH